MNYKICYNIAAKNGFHKNGVQRYKCRHCNKQFQEKYIYNACKIQTSIRVSKLIKEGMGIRNIARYLYISPTTVLQRILKISGTIQKPQLALNQTYEIDEICTFIGSKENRIWICYSYCRATKSVFDFVVGGRSKQVIGPLTYNILCTLPQKIYTDKYQTYASLIPKNIHSTKCRGTNHIERMNLTLRTHLKRLSRRTICFSKSITMLHACLMIYFFC